jgi:hypothetical protein
VTGRNKSVRDRDALVRAARGFIVESGDARWSGGSGVWISGVASYVGVGLFAEDKVSNLTISVVGTLASGLTLAKLGLYSKAGVLLGATADQSTSWAASAGLKTGALATPVVVPATDVYYIGALVIFSTTSPTISQHSAGTIVGQFAMPSALSSYYAQVGLADLPNPATFNPTNVTTGHEFWCGVS